MVVVVITITEKVMTTMMTISMMKVKKKATTIIRMCTAPTCRQIGDRIKGSS